MKIMKIGLFVLLIAALNVNAQFTNTTVAELEKFKDEGTVVVAFSDDENTNKAAEEIMASYWTASKYEVIKQSELAKYLKANPENYVLTYLLNNETHLFTMSQTQMASSSKSGTTTNTKRIGDGLILAKNVKKVNRLEPSDGMMYTFIDPVMDMLDSKAEFIRQIGSMNAVLTYPDLKDNQIGKWKVPTIDYKQVIDKELWIADVDLNEKGKDEGKMQSAYGEYKYKIVTKEEIVNAIVEKREDIAYVACAEYQAGAFMFVVHAAEDNRTLFFVPGTAGFDDKAMEKIKNNKIYGQ